MKTKLRYITLAICTTIIAATTGCKTTKPFLSHTSSTPHLTQLIDTIQSSSLNYQTFASRLIVNATIHEQNSRFRADLKISKDSLILISIQPALGVEAFRAIITPDSIKLIDRINKKYAQEPYEKAAELLNINLNYYNLQDIITNNIFSPGKQKVDKQHFTYTQTTLHTQYLQTEYTFTIDPSTNKLTNHKAETNNNSGYELRYSDFEHTHTTSFPTTIILDTHHQGTPSSNINITLPRINLDKTVRSQTKLSSRYQQVILNKSLINAFKQMLTQQ